MNTVQEFVTSMVKIEFIESSNQYGHYPFQLFAEMTDGTFELNALLLDGNVRACYKRFAEYKKNGAKRIYMSLDFPKGGDIPNDFVMVYSFENNELNLFAIPYKENGEVLDIINESEIVTKIKEEVKQFIK